MPATEEDATPPRKPGSWKAILSAAGLLLLAAFVLLFCWDATPDPAPDLQPRHPLLKDNSANGFIQLTDKWQKYPEPDKSAVNEVSDMLAGGKPWDQAAADALDSSKIPFSADLEQALAMKDWQPQSALPDGGIKTDAILTFHKKSRLANFRVASEFRQSHPQEAFRLFDQLLTASQRNVARSTCLVDGFISLGMLKLSAQAALDASSLPESRLDDRMLEKLQNRLLEVQITGEDVLELLCHEAAWSAVVVKKIKAEGSDPETRKLLPERAENKKFARWFLKPNRTTNFSLEMLRRTRPLLMRPVSNREAGPWGIAEEMTPERGRLEWLSPNRTGLALLREGKDTFVTADNACRGALAILRSTAVCIALRRWQLQNHGDLPDNLSELVPVFISEVPRDPFDGAPLRWNKAGEIVYSIGSDWKDDRPDLKPTRLAGKSPVGRMFSDPVNPGVRLNVPPAP